METKLLQNTKECATLKQNTAATPQQPEIVKRRLPSIWVKLLNRMMYLNDGEYLIRLQVDSGSPRWSVVEPRDWEV